MNFVFMMLKHSKRSFMYFKQFAYFINSLNLYPDMELQICRKFLQNCDIKNVHQKIVMSQSAFGHFLVICPEFKLDLIFDCVNKNSSDVNLQSNNALLKT